MLCLPYLHVQIKIDPEGEEKIFFFGGGGGEGQTLLCISSIKLILCSGYAMNNVPEQKLK